VLNNRKERINIIPLDEYLGISELTYKVTKKMMIKVAYYAQNQVSFDETEKLFREEFGIEVSSSVIREIAEYVGKKVFEKDTREAEEIYEDMTKLPMLSEEEKEDNILYLLVDGASINTRVEDINGSTWRENKLVLAFTDKDMIKRKNESHIITKKEYGAYIGSAEEFKKYMLKTAMKRGYGKIKTVVLISDGATWIRKLCEEIFPDAIQILDKFHLEENIFTYAKYKFKEDEKEYTKWAKNIMKKIEIGRVDKAINLLEKEDYSKLPKTVPNILGYIKNNIKKVDYPTYKKLGYFIGSGAIESGNKVIVQRRLKQAGMRWSVEGAQYMITLRTKVVSNLWNEVTDLIYA
jgi:transposase-like protein